MPRERAERTSPPAYVVTIAYPNEAKASGIARIVLWKLKFPPPA
jgi:hypothetical protein